MELRLLNGMTAEDGKTTDYIFPPALGSRSCLTMAACIMEELDAAAVWRVEAKEGRARQRRAVAHFSDGKTCLGTTAA